MNGKAEQFETQLPEAEDSAGVSRAPASLKPFQLSELDGAATPDSGIDHLADVELDLRVELGVTQLSLAQIMKLRRGSVVPLDAAITEPVRLYADEQLVALGEVMVLNEQFCVRVTELMDGGIQESLLGTVAEENEGMEHGHAA
ncbi:MAG: FliM/FliN family flagellar motor switch protein [Planctomycetota bacterium]|nr:FliM/FliN family flagellar motor switch protein [Planctomycetota bacterium]